MTQSFGNEKAEQKRRDNEGLLKAADLAPRDATKEQTETEQRNDLVKRTTGRLQEMEQLGFPWSKYAKDARMLVEMQEKMIDRQRKKIARLELGRTGRPVGVVGYKGGIRGRT